MVRDRITRSVWLPYLAALLIVLAAAGVRQGFLGILGTRVTYVTFYPATIIAALIGGFPAGLLATVLSAFSVSMMSDPSGHRLISDEADWIGMAVFVLNGVLISYLSLLTHRALIRANEAESQAKLLAEQERSAMAIKESENRLRLFIEHAPASLAMFDREIRYLSVSRRWLTDYNLTERDLIGLSYYDVFPEISEEWKAVHRRALAGEIVRADDDRFDRADGSVQWIRWEVRPWHDAAGDVGGIVVFSEEITERKRAEEELRSNREWLSVTLRSIGDAVLAADTQGRVTFLNPVAAALTGWNIEEALGQPARSVLRTINEQTREPAGDIMERVLREGCTIALANHTALVARDGREIPIEDSAAPIKDKEGNVSGVVLVFHDVTERRRAQDALRASEERFRLFFQEVQDYAIFMLDTEGRVVSWNSGAEQIKGYRADEIIGRHMACFYTPEDVARDWPLQLIQRAAAEGRSEDEGWRVRKDGSRFWANLVITALHDKDGKLRGFSKVSRDITEHKRMEMEREATVEFLHLVNQSTGKDDLIRAAATFFQKQSGCEALGIRLKEGDDYPYYEARGFPDEFVLLENSLCSRDAAGNMLRDSAGEPYIECMCGNVICGRVDLSKPFFSPDGSFWANSTTKLLASTSDADRQTRTRNRCNGEGYESVALIPLRLGTERLGLLQLNDRRTGMFSAETIALWERLAGYLAVALARSLADEAQRESEERLRVMANSIPQLAWIAKADGYIYWYNHRWYEYTGTTPEQMAGWGWQIVHDPDALPGVLERWKESIATGKPFDMVFPLRGADGNFRQFLTRVEPVKNTDGDVIQWCGTNTDITERKQMEDELRKARNGLELRVEERTAELKTYMTKLERSNQALLDFAFIASHDLQEPLRKVKSFGGMLKQKWGGSLGEQGNDYLERMLNATQRMQSLLAALLEYSRLTTKADPFAEVELTKIVGEVLSDLEVRIERTGAEVRVAEFPSIKADPTQMRQLFQNLIGNALKFHQQGEKPVIVVRSEATGNSELQIVVEDNGIGFDEQYLDRIFAPFQRLHGRSEFEGTGMGLAICKKIVERHGGSISAKSTPGGGTSFIVRLPLDNSPKL